MSKIIKKIIRSLTVTLTVLISVTALLFAVARTPKFQSYLAKQFTGFISEKIGTNISIGKVSYSYFNKLNLYDILVKDQNSDTLLCVEQVALRIKSFSPSQRVFRLSYAEIYKPDFRLITDTTGMMNLRWYIELLRGDKEKDTTSTFLLSIPRATIYDGSFSLVNMNDTTTQKEGSIDFSNLRTGTITGDVADFMVAGDSVAFTLVGLIFSESTGFEAYDVDMNVTIRESDLYFRNVKLLSGSSIINAPKIDLIPVDSVGFSDFINRVKLDIHLERSLLGTSDLAFFAPVFKKLNETCYLSGDFSGTVAEMNGRRVELTYGSSTRLRCDFDISGLPSIDNTFAFIDVSDFRTVASDIEGLKIEGKKDLKLPKLVHDMGRITFGGNFTGFNTDFVAYGTFRTEKGNFSTDLSFRPDSTNLFRFKGFIKARDVDMATITGDSHQPGKMWFHADMDGYSASFSHFSAKINGAIDSVGFNNYLYRNIVLQGRVTEKKWDGEVSINDDNIRMDLLGSFDFSGKLPEINFRLNLAEADLYRLNLVETDTLFNASAFLTATFRGNNIDNLDGELKLLGSTLTNSTGEITIDTVLIKSTLERGVPLLKLTSDFADAEVRGPHNYASIGKAIKSELARLFPSKFTMPVTKSELDMNNFTYRADFKEINKLNHFFSTGIMVAPNSTLTGVFHPDSSRITMNFRSDAFGLKGVMLSDLNALASVTGDKMSVSILSDTITLPDQSGIMNTSLIIGTRPDTIDLGINWDNMDNGATKGEISAKGFITPRDKQNPLFQIFILPTRAFVSHQMWQIQPAEIVIDSSTAIFKKLLVNNDDNFFSLDGKISPDPGEKLTFAFNGLNLSYLNKISSRGDNSEPGNEGMEMVVGGRMKGNVEISDLKKAVRIESDIKIEKFTFNGSPYGTVSVGSEWDSKIRAVRINVSNDFEGTKFFEVDGIYKPAGNNLNLTASLSRMPLNVINPVIKSFASDARGLASGRLLLKGRLSQLTLNGALKAEDASLKIDFLKTRYFFNDSIRFTSKGIVLRNIRIADEKKNQGTVNGIIAHNGFNDINLDITCDIRNFMVLNTTYKDADYFYGTAFATGIVGIKGPTNKIAINISARTENNTSFNVPLNSGATVGEYPYILFVDSKAGTRAALAQNKMFETKEKRSGIELNLDLEVTPNAVVQLIMDSKTGDIIKGRGSGDLNISMNSKGEIKMAGVYVIDQDSKYLFTLGNVINKSFDIQEGGTITWNGGMTDALLDLKAIYGTRASLYDIYPEEAFRNRIDVECQINLSGKLMNPVVGLGIDAPKADDETREYLRMAVNTEEELSKQFLYLLVMNSFYPDPSIYSASSSQSTSQGASAIGVTTTEMLSNQFSNWLSQISNDFDIGFNYRPGNEITTQEVEAAFKTQILNDKVTFNGNVDVGGKQTNTKASNVTTDFTLEYELTDRLKFKAFNRANDDVLYETSPYTQGVGILYRHEFNRLRDLFNKKKEDKKKSGDTNKP